jgi:hypothetical protein
MLVGAAIGYGVQVYNNYQNGYTGAAAWTKDISATTIITGSLVVGAAVITAPVIIAAAADTLAGAALLSGSTTLMETSITTAGVGVAVTNALYGEAAAAEVSEEFITDIPSVQRVSSGGPRIAVIGRNMERVNSFAKYQGAETWTGWDESLSKAENLANNRAWAEGLVTNNYRVYDIGLDPKYTSMGNYDTGEFYRTECQVIFGDSC